MRGSVAPLVQAAEMSNAQRIPWVGGRQVEAEAEAAEVNTKVIDIRVSVVELSVGRELFCYHSPEARAYLGHDDLGGFGVEIPTKALEVRAEQEVVATQVLVEKSRVERHGRSCGRTLGVDVGETRHPRILPVQERDGRHCRPLQRLSIGAPDELLLSETT
jgi:hypothetical protein